MKVCKEKTKPVMRVLHAPTEIAGQSGITARALRQIGVQAYSFSYFQHPFGYKNDLCLNFETIDNVYKRISKALPHFLRFLKEYDVFHFYYGVSLLPNNADLPLLKLLGKKVVMEFWGSECRLPSILSKRNPWYINAYGERDDINICRMKRIARFVDAAIAPDWHLLQFLGPYFSRVFISAQRVPVDEYPIRIPDARTVMPLVVHSPSQSDFKGTDAVIKAVESLAKRLTFQFLLIRNTHYKEVLDVTARADIVIDQLRAGAHGVYAVEAMAMGKPVICYIEPYMMEHLPVELPIVSANPDTLANQLELLLSRPDLRQELGTRSRQYVEKYHDARKVAKKLVEIYEQL